MSYKNIRKKEIIPNRVSPGELLRTLFGILKPPKYPELRSSICLIA